MREMIMTLAQAEAATGGKLFLLGEDRGINCVVTDNRKAEPGALFVAIKGERADGHSFINAAFESGASCVICEREPKEPKGSYILVKSSTKALRDLAAYYRSTLSIPIIGIIGSVGKTSCKEMVSAVLSRKYNTHKTKGNFNNDIGLPLTLLGITPDHEAAVVEMGINHFGEMDLLGSIAVPDMIVFTNVRECHLEFLGDLSGVLKAKSEVFSHMKPGSCAFINGDDVTLKNLSLPEGIKQITFGEGDCNVSGRVTEDKGIYGSRILISLGGEEKEAVLNVPGIHNLYHALAGAAVGHALGIDLSEIILGIESVTSLGGRSNIIKAGDITLIDDCYNASPASVNAAIDLLSKTRCSGRRIAVLGDMGELGEEARSLHRSLGDNDGFKNIHQVYLAGELVLEIKKALLDGGYPGEIYTFNTGEELSASLKSRLGEGDVVLIKASHFMHFEKIVESLKTL